MKLLLVFTEIQIKYGSYAFQAGLGAISAWVKREGGHEVALAYMGPKFDPAPFRQRLRDFKPDVIGFYTTEDQLRFARKLLAEPGVSECFTVFGGPFATLNPEFLEEEPRLDAICVGEGELPINELLNRLADGRDPGDIPGLWVRRGAEIIPNPSPPFLPDLDSLPFVDRSIFAEAPEIRHVGITQISHRNSFRISRGCPYGCTFCSNQRLGMVQQGRFTRFRSVDKVMQEIQEVTERYEPREIYFDDDTFTLDQRFLDEFVEKYPQTCDLPFEFFSHIGPTTIPVLEKLRGVGGRRVSFGVESGNEEIRTGILKKRFSNDQVIEVFREAKKMGYQAEAFVMAGLPDEDPETFRDTADLLRTIQPDLYSLSIYFPFRGTELYDHALKQGYLPGPVDLDDAFVSRRRALLNMPNFPPKVVAREVRKFPWRVYGRTSLRKALLFRAYEMPIGDSLLQLLAPVRRFLRVYAVGGVTGAHKVELRSEKALSQ